MRRRAAGAAALALAIAAVTRAGTDVPRGDEERLPADGAVPGWKRAEPARVYSGPELYYRCPNGLELHNVSAVYLCRDFSGEIVVDPAEGTKAAFFAVKDLPSDITPPNRVVIADFVRRYQEVMA